MAPPDDSKGYADADGQFRRPASSFRSFVSADPASEFPAEKDRYVLYIHVGCPWAHRANIVRSLKGLEDIVQMVVLDDAEMPGRGWRFSGKPGYEKDPFYGFIWLRDLYEKAAPGYEGRVTVPVLWDTKSETIVNNESSEIIRMFYTAFDDLLPEHLREASKGEKALFPAHLQGKIEEMNGWVYEKLNNGVYKTGFASSQEAYEEHLFPIFEALDRLEAHLKEAGTEYLFGDFITEADIRLYTTLIRFDVAYFTIFKCNLRMIRYEYPLLHDWLRRLYWDETEKTNGGAFKKTVFFDEYRKGYARAARTAVVPVGPKPDIMALSA